MFRALALKARRRAREARCCFVCAGTTRDLRAPSLARNSGPSALRLSHARLCIRRDAGALAGGRSRAKPVLLSRPPACSGARVPGCCFRRRRGSRRRGFVMCVERIQARSFARLLTRRACEMPVLLSQSEGSPSLYAATDATAGAVRTLAASQRGAGAPAAGAAAWDGCWEVFYAPHMRSVEALARFRPVRYVLSGGGTHMRSDVGYSFAGAAGWLSAEGDVVPRAEGGVDVLLRDFWVEPLSTGADAPLPPPRPENPISGGARVSALDALINAVGRAVRVCLAGSCRLAWRADRQPSVTIHTGLHPQPVGVPSPIPRRGRLRLRVPSPANGDCCSSGEHIAATAAIATCSLKRACAGCCEYAYVWSYAAAAAQQCSAARHCECVPACQQLSQRGPSYLRAACLRASFRAVVPPALTEPACAPCAAWRRRRRCAAPPHRYRRHSGAASVPRRASRRHALAALCSCRARNQLALRRWSAARRAAPAAARWASTCARRC